MKVLTNEKILQKRIQKAISEKIKDDTFTIDKITDNIHDIGISIKEAILDEIYRSETYASLTGGQLRLDFGLSDSVVAALPEFFEGLVETYYELIPSKGIKIVLDITHHRAASSEMVGVTTRAQYYSERSGELVDWLYWLLFEGSIEINDEWVVKKIDGKGRSHMGYMVRIKEGKGFSIDPYFAGVEGDNFVTKAMIAAKPKIEQILKEYTK